MSAFVDECRREWKRLGVPEPAADEMADDLRADLEEAERDGASAADLLGASLHDPRGFAAAWANERHLVPPHHRRSIDAGWAIAGALVALIAVCALTAALLLRGNRTEHAARHGRTPPTSTAAKVRPRRSPLIVGTTILAVTLMPSDIRLYVTHVLGANAARGPRIPRPPSRITIAVKNSGDSPIARVRVVLQIGSYTFSREETAIPVNYERRVHFTLPRTLVLPPRFLIVARTVPVRGETNTTNNQFAWRLRLKA